MGKSRNSRADKEYSREQKLQHENRELKRALAKLRKQLERIDLDRYVEIKEIVEQSHATETEEDSEKLIAKLRKRWACRECHSGFLEICLYNRIAETYYYRQCNNCSQRTKSQKYDASSVTGILKPEKEDSGKR